MAILLILLSSLFRGQKVNCLEISNTPLKIFRFRYPTLSLHHVSTHENQHVRQHKRAVVIVKTKKTQATCHHKTLISLLTPCSLLANPLRSLCVLSGFAREELLSRDIFLAKPQRSQRRSMNIFAAAYHGLCFFAATFHDSSRLMLAIARLAQKIVRRWGSLEEAEFFITPV